MGPLSSPSPKGYGDLRNSPAESSALMQAQAPGSAGFQVSCLPGPGTGLWSLTGLHWRPRSCGQAVRSGTSHITS